MNMGINMGMNMGIGLPIGVNPTTPSSSTHPISSATIPSNSSHIPHSAAMSQYNSNNSNSTSGLLNDHAPSNITSHPHYLHNDNNLTNTNNARSSSTGNSGHNGSSLQLQQSTSNRPKITTTMWEDERTLCYQVEAAGVSVVRRADNNMINGTKLLNVAKMTRGRRDGILKAEKTRHVVKIGSMHLKGVWIPFERAFVIAQREGIADLLYPLFVKDIQRIIQQGIPTVKMGQYAVASAPNNPIVNQDSMGISANLSIGTHSNHNSDHNNNSSNHNHNTNHSIDNNTNTSATHLSGSTNQACDSPSNNSNALVNEAPDAQTVGNTTTYTTTTGSTNNNNMPSEYTHHQYYFDTREKD